MSINRVLYATKSVAIGPYGSASGTPVHGAQTVALNTTYNLEQVFELGQLEIYENIENLPDVEMTIEKVLDGYPLVYHLSTPTASSASLLNRTNERSDVFLSIFSDSQDNASGTPTIQAYCSGMYVNSLDYNLPVEGNCTETVSLVGNDKIWVSADEITTAGSGFAFDGHFDGTDSPASGVQRRQDVTMGLGGSVWPSVIPGVTIVNGSGYNVGTSSFGAHIQDVSISVNLGREDLFELGRRKPYFRFASFPTSIDTTINITAGGDDPGDAIDAVGDAENLTNEPIVIHLDDGTKFDLGTKNKIQNISYSGGDTDGGVVTASYSFQNFNILEITHPADPASV